MEALEYTLGQKINIPQTIDAADRYVTEWVISVSDFNTSIMQAIFEKLELNFIEKYDPNTWLICLYSYKEVKEVIQYTQETSSATLHFIELF